MTTFKKILIGIDDSKFAKHAAKTGLDLAKQFGAAVGLVHIIEAAYIPAPVTDATMGMPLETGTNMVNVEMLEIQNHVSDDMIENTIKTYGKDVEVTHFTDYGSTADGIISCSKEFEADLIVIGTHSRTGLDRLFMGSVAEHVVRHAEMPVLVVPFKEND